MSQETNHRQRPVLVRQDNQTQPHERTLTIMEGAPEQTLPPLTGREIIRTPITIPGDPPQRGIRLSYSLTLAELTQRCYWLITNHREIMNKIAQVENNVGPYIDLPLNVMNFHDKMQKGFDEMAKEINQILDDIYNQLESLLQGKAKPNDETLNLVLQNLRQHGDRIQILETRLRPEVGTDSFSRSQSSPANTKNLPR